jgi:aerobic carbon-monoxide dehydrogenase large subunit
VRRRNFIAPADMPYKTATGRAYDSGEFLGHMERAQKIADWQGFGTRAAESKSRGKLRGIGLASYIEACGGASAERARLKLEPDGTVTLWIGTQSNGQGHKTTYAQIIAQQPAAAPSARVRSRPAAFRFPRRPRTLPII